MRVRSDEKRKASCSDQRPDNERESPSVARDQPTSPARKQKHDHREWNERGASSCGRKSLHLNEIERKKIEETRERSVEQQSQKICAGKIHRAKERER